MTEATHPKTADCQVAALAREALELVEMIGNSTAPLAAESERLFEIEDLAALIRAKSHEGTVFHLGIIAAAVDKIVGLVPVDTQSEARRQQEAVERMLLSIAHFLQKGPASTDELFDFYLSTTPYHAAAAH